MSVAAAGRTAEVTPVYGMREVGGFGIRGWRVFCPECGHLHPARVVHRNVKTSKQQASDHRCRP